MVLSSHLAVHLFFNPAILHNKYKKKMATMFAVGSFLSLKNIEIKLSSISPLSLCCLYIHLSCFTQPSGGTGGKRDGAEKPSV